ncbi:MotA/TolQ/ExbB proton channel family protein [candidate division WOR-3 bacterium]|nr:MotA/TolQ/ExbB proton channel family protein [candidate division WOR-3 bacterium]
MVAYFKIGGIYMWPLLGCILVGAAFIIERFISYALARIDIKKFMADLKTSLKKEGGVEKGIEYCKSNKSPVARITEAALATYKKVGPQKDAIEEAISNAGTTELAFLDRGLPVLAAVSTIAPIIGFLGTVMGMIHAFQAIAIAGEVEPTLVATGIQEALVTTATGLSIAFPVVAFHVYFTTRSNGYTRMMESAATELVIFLVEEKP